MPTNDALQGSEPPAERLRRLWERMVSIFGRPWTNVHGVTPHKMQADGKPCPTGALSVSGDTWSKALIGITGAQMAVGLEACLAEALEFPPAAGHFRGMCLGIPSFAVVKIDATRPEQERSAFTRMTWQFLDTYAYRNANTRDGERLLRDAYEVAKEMRMRGAPLPGELLAVEDEKQPVRVASREEQAKHAAVVRELFRPVPDEEELAADGDRSE